MRSAYISEIYPTIQGEGPFTGERQVFLRLAGCPLRCDYCDTPGSLEIKGHPFLDVEEITSRVDQICRDQMIETVSVTGGEPLTQVSFLEVLLPLLKKRKRRIYLETAGIHPTALNRVIEFCDVVSMDLKLPSATGKIFWNQHAQFLNVAKGKVFVKIVIEKQTPSFEVEKAISLLEKRDPPPLLVLQPVSPQGQVQAPTDFQMEELISFARSRLPRVQAMPQQHKAWAIR